MNRKDQHWRAFGALFFLLHQDALLWLLNAPVLRWWFRWVLRIHGDRSAMRGRRITRILPHAIHWWEGSYQKFEFRTHAKFGKRLYFAFRPLWWALHAWDWAIADRWLPELSFGFDTLTAWPNADADADPTTTDGSVAQVYAAGSGQTWATIRAAAGTDASDDGTSAHLFYIIADTVSSRWVQLRRGIHLFDTSALGVGAEVSAGTLSYYGSSKSEGISGTPSLNIYSSDPASNTGLAAGDFDSLGSTALCDTAITHTNFSTTGYNDFALNSSGISNVNTTGISKFGTRNSNWDAAGTAPTWSSGVIARMNAVMADEDGTDYDPRLVLTYTPGSTAVPIADSGSGSDALLVSAETPLSDAGSGTDALAVAAALSMADSGSGEDALALTGLVPVADAGEGADALQVDAAVPLPDIGAGIDGLTVAATQPISDGGEGSDAVAVSAGEPMGDAGTGEDALGVVALIPLSDMGIGVDALEVFRLLENCLLADSGHGVDSLEVTRDDAVADPYVPIFRRRRRKGGNV